MGVAAGAEAPGAAHPVGRRGDQHRGRGQRQQAALGTVAQEARGARREGRRAASDAHRRRAHPAAEPLPLHPLRHHLRGQQRDPAQRHRRAALEAAARHLGADVSEIDDLRAAARDLLEDNAPGRSNLDDNPGVWKRLSTEMGLTSLPVEAPLSWTATVLEETGRVLLRAPSLPTVVTAAVTRDPGLADGSLTAAVQTDEVVPHATGADLLLDL